MPPLDILYVDAEPDLREIVSVALELDGALAVRTCGTAGEAWREIERRTPDLIILDVMMPDVDGPALFAALKNHSTAATVPVVFMTAKVLEAELARLRRLSPAGIVQKPFDPRILAAKIRGFHQAILPDAAGPEPLDALTERLRIRFKVEAPGTAERLKAGSDLPVENRDSARWIAHSLCGTAGTLGYADIATLAAEIDATPSGQPVAHLADRLAAALWALAA